MLLRRRFFSVPLGPLAGFREPLRRFAAERGGKREGWGRRENKGWRGGEDREGARKEGGN